IRVPERFVTALETALGHHLQLVLTEQPEAAREILEDLQANKRGRASVAPLALIRNGHQESGNVNGNVETQQSAVSPGSVEVNGQPVPAIALVESDAAVRPVLERLLG